MADSTPPGQTQAPSAGQQNQYVPPTTPAIPMAPPADANPSQSPAPATSSGKRGRGRPPGSKNRSKPPVYINEESTAARHIQLVIPPGCDLVATLEHFARQHRTGIHVGSGYGSLANITLRDAPPIPGVMDLVSLAGTFLDPYQYNGTIEGAFPSYIPGGAAPWLKMILAGNTWNITRAYAVSSALTASDVLVNLITFRQLQVQRVDPSMFAPPQLAYPPPPPVMPALRIGSSSGGEASGSGFGGDAQMGGEMPPPAFGVPGSSEQQNRMPPPPPGVGFRPPKYPRNR